MLGKLRDIKDIVFQETKYSKREKHQLTKLCKIAKDEFSDNYHESVFNELGIKEPIGDIAITNFEFLPFKLLPFKQNGSHLFNVQIKQISENLEKYILNPTKNSTSFRVNKIVCIALHKLVTEKLFKSRYDTSCEIEVRVIEVCGIQDFICQIIECQTPKFTEDKDVLDCLCSVNTVLDKISDILESQKEQIEKKCILGNFEGKNHLETVINNAIEYISSLPGNKSGFSACKLFSDANKKDSDVQKFLIGTNIGKTTVTTFLAIENPQKLFSSRPDTQNLHRLMSDDVDEGLDINKDLWQNKTTRDLIIDSLLLLEKLSYSANIANDIKINFSGVAGNVILLVPDSKKRITNVFSMTSDGLLKLQEMIKEISVKLEDVETITSVKKTRLKRLHRTCSDTILKAIANYNEIENAINAAPPAKSLASEFQTKMIGIGISIDAFQNAMLPLLPPDRQGRYAIECGRAFELLVSTNDRSSRRSGNLLALTGGNSEISNFTRVLAPASSSVQIEEVTNNEIADIHMPTASSNANSGVTTFNARDNMTNIAISYINQTLQNNNSSNASLARPVASGTEIDRSKTRMIDAFKKQRSEGVVAVKENKDQVLAEYKSSKDTKRAAKVVCASGAALMTPAVAGIVTSVTIHAIPTIALTGAAAVAPIGAGVAAGVGGFTFSKENDNNQKNYYKLCSWGACLYNCVDELMKAATSSTESQEQKHNLNFALKTLEAVLFYSPDKDKILLDDFTAKSDAQNTILNNSIKLRYAFLKFIQEKKLCLIKILDDQESEILEGSSFKFQDEDKQTINAARDAFICIILSAMESLKIEKEKLLKEENRSPNQYFEGASASGVINGEYTQIN